MPKDSMPLRVEGAWHQSSFIKVLGNTSAALDPGDDSLPRSEQDSGRSTFISLLAAHVCAPSQMGTASQIHPGVCK